MAHLYTNNRGREVDTHSYSSGATFELCRRKYYLQKIEGWRSKADNAATKLGVAVEEAIMFFHQNGCKPGDGVDHFKLQWVKYREFPNLVYKEKEGDWKDFYQIGSDMLALYELTLPSLPIKNPDFQLNYKREVFPGTTLAGIYDQGYVDCLSRADWDHPMLPKINIPKNAGPFRPVIIDIKTSGKGLDLTPQILSMDPQLRRYASLSSINDVAFLWFHRMKPGSFDKGNEVTFLTEFGKWTPGLRAVVQEYDSEAETVVVAAHHDVERIKTVLDAIKGKGSKQRKEEALLHFLDDGTLTLAPSSSVTKQRMRFVAVRLNPEDVKDDAKIVAKQIVEIHQAAIDDYWPQTGAGVRFPKSNCGWCEMRGHCLRDDKLRDSLLVQISTPSQEDWLDDVPEMEEE